MYSLFCQKWIANFVKDEDGTLQAVEQTTTRLYRIKCEEFVNYLNDNNIVLNLLLMPSEKITSEFMWTYVDYVKCIRKIIHAMGYGAAEGYVVQRFGKYSRRSPIPFQNFLKHADEYIFCDRWDGCNKTKTIFLDRWGGDINSFCDRIMNAEEFLEQVAFAILFGIIDTDANSPIAKIWKSKKSISNTQFISICRKMAQKVFDTYHVRITETDPSYCPKRKEYDNEGYFERITTAFNWAQEGCLGTKTLLSTFSKHVLSSLGSSCSKEYTDSRRMGEDNENILSVIDQISHIIEEFANSEKMPVNNICKILWQDIITHLIKTDNSNINREYSHDLIRILYEATKLSSCNDKPTDTGIRYNAHSWERAERTVSQLLMNEISPSYQRDLRQVSEDKNGCNSKYFNKSDGFLIFFNEIRAQLHTLLDYIRWVLRNLRENSQNIVAISCNNWLNATSIKNSNKLEILTGLWRCLLCLAVWSCICADDLRHIIHVAFESWNV
ncbi:MAG: hypothetical protein FVQ84_18920 [Planctomycetes bacterium]|nr:hypothetical protein [Planctomycetota bacterium]